MRVAAISDVHGNLPALEAVLADIDGRGVDLTLNLGDIVSGPLWPRETAELLMTRALPTIAGNHERQLLDPDLAGMGCWDRFARTMLTGEQVAWISALPPTLHVGGGIFMCHGTPANDLDYLLETVTPAGKRAATAAEAEARLGANRFALLLCGHSHTSRQLRLSDGSFVANPGSVGLQAYRWDRPHPHETVNQSPAARYAIFEKKEGEWEGEPIVVEYPFETAALKAEEQGAADWAHALRTGRNLA